MCMLFLHGIEARSELGHDRLGREAVADRGRCRARGRVEAQHGAAECRAALKGYLASSPSMNRLKNMSE